MSLDLSLDFFVSAFPHPQHAAPVWCMTETNDKRNPYELTLGTKWFGAKVWIDSGRTNHRGLGALWSEMGSFRCVQVVRIDFASLLLQVLLFSWFWFVRHTYKKMNFRGDGSKRVALLDFTYLNSTKVCLQANASTSKEGKIGSRTYLKWRMESFFAQHADHAAMLSKHT